MVGIYELKGDLLVLCGADKKLERPTEFKAGNRVVLLTLRREAKGAAKQDDATAKKLRQLAERLQAERVENERLRAEMAAQLAELQAKLDRERARQQYLACTLKVIDIEKSQVTVQLARTTLEVKNIPLAVDAKFSLNGKECLINDLKADMEALVRVD